MSIIILVLSLPNVQEIINPVVGIYPFVRIINYCYHITILFIRIEYETAFI